MQLDILTSYVTLGQSLTAISVKLLLLLLTVWHKYLLYKYLFTQWNLFLLWQTVNVPTLNLSSGVLQSSVLFHSTVH